MGGSQSSQQQQQNYQEYNQSYQKQPQQINKVEEDKRDPMTKLKSKDLFYYIVALKDKENKIIEGYDLMIAVDHNHVIQNTTVLSMEAYNKIGDEKFKRKFKNITKKISNKKKGVKKGGVVINNNQQCPPCALQQQQQQQQQIQYQNNTTFGQSFVSGLGTGLGVMSAVVLMDLLLPRFNYFGFGFYDSYGYDSHFTEINNYYPDNYDEGYEDGYEDGQDNQEEGGDDLETSNIDNGADNNDDYGNDDGGDDGGDYGGGGRKAKGRRYVRNNQKPKSKGRPRKAKS